MRSSLVFLCVFLCLTFGAAAASAAAPTVTLTSPANHCNTCGPQVELKARSDFSPTRWEVWLDGHKVYSAISSGAQFDQIITAPSGTWHRIVVSALDTSHAWHFAAPVYVYAAPALAIAAATVPPAYTVTPYSTRLAATGGTPPYTWSVSWGKLPPGLTLAATTGVLDGTPTQAGSYAFGVRITDSNGAIAVLKEPMMVHNSAITVKWFYSTTGIDRFNVYRSTTSGGPYSMVGSTTNMSYTDRSFVAGTSYFYTVTAVIGGVETQFSDEIEAVTR